MAKKIIFTPDDGNHPPKAGEFPYTRGIHPTMYTEKPWTMRQYAGFGDAKSSNARYRYLLSQGTTGLSIAFDLPTQMGYDSDDDLARGEVGRVGVAISSLEDMGILLDGIPLGEVSTSMTINATASILLCLYVATAEKQGVARAKLKGTIQNDILKEYIARGTYVFPPKPSLKITSDIFQWCKEELPNWNTISISGYHIREAGSTAVQEIAFTLSNGFTYVEEALAKGLAIDDFAPRLSFFFNVHNDFFEEIAKFRAARTLWAKTLKEKYGAKNPKSLLLRFHAQTAGSTLIAQQVDTNVVRVSLQCLAAALGGAQSIHTNSRDEALGLPTEEAALLALRTQQVIAYESGITQIVDPVGGSYAVEAMTARLEKEAQDLIDEIYRKGGVVACIQNEWQQNLIQEAAYQYQQGIESGSRPIVGLNAFQETKEVKQPVLRIDPQIEVDQVSRLKAFKANRKASDVGAHLKGLSQKAKDDENILPSLLEALRSGCTLGETVKALVDVYGRYRP